MSTKPLLIIGLGNPGKKYESTRHNAGFLYVDHLANRYDAESFTLSQKFDALTSEHKISATEKIIFAKPQTFMNQSGKSVSALAQFYKADIAHDVVIVHDDLDLPIGTWKVSRDKNAGGQNGVKDIIEKCGSKDFLRIRIGIDGRSSAQREHMSGSDYVLGRFTDQENVILMDVFSDIIKEIESSI